MEQFLTVFLCFVLSLFVVSVVMKPAPALDTAQDNLPIPLMPVSTVSFVLLGHSCVYICFSRENVWSTSLQLASLIVNALDSESSSPGLSPGHRWCSWARYIALKVPLPFGSRDEGGGW